MIATNTNSDPEKRITWDGGFDPFGRDWKGFTLAGALNQNVFLRLPGQFDDFAWQSIGAGFPLYYNVHRWYDFRTGKYTKPDPVGLAGGINPYVYVASNPTLAIDQLGLQLEVPPDAPPVFGPLPSGCEAISGIRFKGFTTESPGSRDVWKLVRCRQLSAVLPPPSLQPVDFPACRCEYRRAGVVKPYKRRSNWAQDIQCGCVPRERTFVRDEMTWEVPIPFIDTNPPSTRWETFPVVNGACFAPPALRTAI